MHHPEHGVQRYNRKSTGEDVLEGEGAKSLYFHRRYKMQKSIGVALIVVSLSASSVSAQNYIYDKPYGGSKVGRLENNGVFYDHPYGGSSIGRIDEKGFVFDRAYGGSKVGRMDKDGFVYDKPYGGSKIGRVKDGFVYDRAYGGSKIGKTDIPAGAAYWLLKK